MKSLFIRYECGRSTIFTDSEPLLALKISLKGRTKGAHSDAGVNIYIQIVAPLDMVKVKYGKLYYGRFHYNGMRTKTGKTNV